MSLKDKTITAFRNKVFLSGLVLKLFLVILLFPDIQKEWFVPFLVNILENPSLTPWQSFLNQYHEINAFPYGPVMILSHLPFVFIGWVIDSIFSSSVFSLIGFKVSLLFADLMLLLILVQIYKSNYQKVLIYYWLSPIVIYVTYIHGQTDIIPISLLTASLYYLKTERFKRSAITLALSISAKFSMLIAFPFLCLYLIVNKKYRQYSIPFILMVFLTVFLIHGAFIFDKGFYDMVIINSQTQRLFWISLDFYNSVSVYITPLLMLLILYLVWRQSKINFELLIAAVTIGFFAIILSGTPPPGWYIWLSPLLVLHQIKHGKSAVILVSAFSAVLVLFYFLTANSGYFAVIDLNLKLIREILLNNISDKIIALLFTLLFGLGIIIMVQVIRSGIRENDYFLLTKRTLSIGIAGSLKSGKETLAQSIVTLFGKHSVCRLTGNNYHKWDNFSPMWKTITKLNPRANLLTDFTNDAMSLIHRKDISNRSYNTDSGYFSKLRLLKSNDIIIISGLHALFTKHLRKQLDLKIFVEIDESLKSYFNPSSDLNISASKADNDDFINCQKNYADIIFFIEPLNKESISHPPYSKPLLKLKTIIRHGIYYADLQRAFIGLCNLHVNLQLSEEMGTAILDVEGELDFRGEDGKLVIQLICPELLEILDIKPKWHNGMLGIMQVIVLVGINQALQERK